MVGSITIRRYHRMGLLDSGRWTVDGIVRATFSDGRECANCSCGHIRIITDGIMRTCRWDSGCANGSYGLMVGSIIMRQYYRMGSLESARQTGDGSRWLRLKGCWCTISSYRLIVGNIVIRWYHCIHSSYSGTQTADGIARASYWWDRGCANGSYELIGIYGIMMAACYCDSWCLNGSHELNVWSIVIQQYRCMGLLDSRK